jgi:hypothetical protein
MIRMGTIAVWEVESCTEIEAARGRSPQGRLVGRHREMASAAGILSAEIPYRFCDLAWFPRFIHTGERRRFTLYQVQELPGVGNGVYAAAAPDADIKVLLHRWFGEAS